MTKKMPSSNAILAKARAMYGKKLTEQNYNDLLAQNTMGEIVAYLRNETAYGELLEGVPQTEEVRARVERCLRRSAYIKYGRLLRYRFTKDKDFFGFLVIHSEVQELLHTIRLLAVGGVPTPVELPEELLQYTKIDLDRLSKVTTYEELLNVLEKTEYYDMVAGLLLDQVRENPSRLTSVEITLMEFYFRKIFRLIAERFAGKAREQLEDMFRTQVDSINISLIYRMKTFFYSEPKEIRDCLLPNPSNLKPWILEALINSENADQIKELIGKTPYRNDFDGRGAEYVEEFTRQVKNRVGKQFIRGSIEPPVVFMAFVFLTEIEIQNLIYLIEGKKYDIPLAELQKLLIY